MSRLPNLFTVSSTAAPTAAVSRTSIVIGRQRLPSSSTCLAVSRRSSSVPSGYVRSAIARGASAITTFAPSAASAKACARPCPRAPPVINATRPSSAPMDSYLRATRQTLAAQPVPSNTSDNRFRVATTLLGVDEDRLLSRHSSHDRGDLVGLADQPGLQVGFEHQRSRGVVAGPGLVVKALRGADRVRGFLSDLVRECQRRRKRILGSPSHQTELDSLTPGKDATGECQLFRDVDRYKPRQCLREAHVGYEAPLDLHDGQFRVRRGDPDVRTERDL